MNSLMGLELEGMVLDRYGNPVNRADEVIGLSKHSSQNGHVTKELTKTGIEVITNPHDTLDSLNWDIRGRLNSLEGILDRLELEFIPFSNVGVNPEDTIRRGYPRYEISTGVFGEEGEKIYGHFFGTHHHQDISELRSDEQRIVDYYNLLISLNPATITLLANTPWIRGVQKGKSSRVSAMRDDIFKGDIKIHGDLPPYASSSEEIEELQQRQYNTLEELANHPEFSQYVKLDDANWTPLRFRNGKGTLEMRDADATLPSLALSMATFYRGIRNYFDKNKLEVKISETGEFRVTDSEIIIPDYQTLRNIERKAIRQGLENEQVVRYTEHLLDIAEDGLEPHERKYLLPFRFMLRERRSLSDLIYDVATQEDPSTNSSISGTTAADLNLWLRELYRKDLGNSGFIEDWLESGGLKDPRIIDLPEKKRIMYS